METHTLLELPSHPDPDIVFMQPLRPGCWIHPCPKAPTTCMWIGFPLTMFVQRLCDEHAEHLAALLAKRGLVSERREGVTLFDNISLRDSLRASAMDGTLRNSDLVLPTPFPRQWYRHAVSVTLIEDWPHQNQCWMYDCESAPTASVVLFSMPGSRGISGARTSNNSTLVALPGRVSSPKVQGLCRTHSQAAGALLFENNFSNFPQSAGGMVYRNPKCTFPFGTDPDGGGGGGEEHPAEGDGEIVAA